MTRLIILAVLCMTISFCTAQTQSEMTQDAGKNSDKADKELNAVYQSILKDYRTDTVFIKNLKTAQRLWIQFRDAEMMAKYPEREPGYYGSAQTMCWNTYFTELTEERTKKLKVWLTGIKGDICSGSVQPEN